MLEKKDGDGIPFTEEGGNYIEALVYVTYMHKHYYHEQITIQCQEAINNYFRQKYESIIIGNEDKFELHQGTNWRIYLFGMAALSVQDIRSLFFIRNNHNILESLSENFTEKTTTNIPYILELCNLYNAIKTCLDPFNNEVVIEEIKHLETEIDSLKRQLSKVGDNHRNTMLKVPVATGTFLIYALLLGGGCYLLGSWGVDKLIKTPSGITSLADVLITAMSAVAPIIVFFIKKVRMYFFVW